MRAAEHEGECKAANPSEGVASKGWQLASVSLQTQGARQRHAIVQIAAGAELCLSGQFRVVALDGKGPHIVLRWNLHESFGLVH